MEGSRVDAIRLIRKDSAWLQRGNDTPAGVGGVLAADGNGRCVFRNAGCDIQTVLGHSALPTACQHFPREVLIDARGVFVTLSHYCPTALDLLLAHEGPVTIVDGPRAVPDGEAEGLDARDVLPPLLSEGLLADLDGYSEWEAHVVRVLTTDDNMSAEEALEALARDLERLQQWRPSHGLLRDAVASLQPRVSGARRTGPEEPVIRRYLAARAFASWMAYEAGGLCAVLRSLDDALAVVRRYRTRMALAESIRQADLELVHLTPRDELVARYRSGR